MRPPHRLALLVPLAGLACKPAPGASEPLSPTTPVATPAITPEAEPPAGPPPEVVVYGQFRIPAPDQLLQQIRQQLVPPGQRPMLDDAMLRSMLGMALGPHSGLAQKIDLTHPMGCVVTSPKRHDRPVVCAVAYQGGFDRLMEDLGPDGYVTGGADYAHYRIDGRPIYFNAVGQHVAFAFAPDLTAAVRDRLERDVIGAPAGPEDLAGTAFLGDIFADAGEEIEGLVGLAQPRVPPGADSWVTEEYMQATREAQRRQWMSYGELERADLWLDLSPDRVRLGYRGTAREGTPTHAAYEGQRATRHDPALLKMLPAEAFVVGSMHFDMSSMMDDPMLGAYIKAMGTLDDTGAGAAFAEVVRDSMAAWGELATGHAAMALVHEGGTKGGMVATYRLVPGSDAQARLQQIFERFEKIPTQQLIPFEYRLRKGAVRAGKLRGDMLTIRPNAEGRERIESGVDPTWTAMARALGGKLELQIAYAQRGDLLVMAMAPQKAERYLKRALAAAGGRKNLAGRTPALAPFERHAEGSMVMAADVGAVIDWLVAIGATEPPPKAVGGGMDDVVLWMQPAGPRQRELVLDVSQGLVDTLLTLGG